MCQHGLRVPVQLLNSGPRLDSVAHAAQAHAPQAWAQKFKTAAPMPIAWRTAELHGTAGTVACRPCTLGLGLSGRKGSTQKRHLTATMPPAPENRRWPPCAL